MKKADAETAVKSLAIDWRSETGRYGVEPQLLPSVSSTHGCKTSISNA